MLAIGSALAACKGHVPQVAIPPCPRGTQAGSSNLAEAAIIDRPPVSCILQVCLQDQVLIPQEIRDSLGLNLSKDGDLVSETLGPFNDRVHRLSFRMAGLEQ